LLATTEKKAKNDPLVWEVAASGFWDTSRLAASDVTMMVDIITTNRFAILDAIENFEASMAGLKKLITASNQNQIRKMLSSIQYLRKTLIPK